MPLREAPVEPNAPHLISASIAFLLTARPSTRSQKSHSDENGPSSLLYNLDFARFEDARKVLIAGDFNNWSPASTPMTSSPVPGMWRMSLPLPRGRYRYRFVVDGKWVTDPNNQYVETNQFGELNNVIEVE